MNHRKWDIDNIADQNGKIAIVTGASSGIGYETARVLANKNAEVILAVRDKQKGEKALNRIKSQNSSAKVKLMILDLASLESIKEFSIVFKRNYNKLDILINNAGVMIPPYSKTKDGYELQFGTNHLGHFSLTAYLIDHLRKTPNSRIVNVSSNAHKIGKLDFDDLNWEKRKYNKWQSYGDSKIANIYFTYELGRRLSADTQNPLVMAAHPGWTATDLQRHTGLFEFLNALFAQDSKMGALPTLFAAVAEDVKSGDYYGPSGLMEMRGYPKKVETNKLSKDDTISKKLWQISEQFSGVEFNLN
jgi:NAD(P)-dependent dehydrogenase (short-subunit alcohol dehydrogenase family)